MKIDKILSGRRPSKAAYANVLLAIGLALLVSVVFILALGENPIAVFSYIIKGAFSKASSILEIFAKATPLITIGLGICVASSAGMTNLGGDGQFYIGAMASVCVGLFVKAPTVVIWILSILVAIIAGGIWGGIAGFLKSTIDTSEVIIAIMLNYIALYIVGFLLSNPLQAPGGLPQTRAIDKSLYIPKIMTGARAHWGIVAAFILAIAVWFVMSRTLFGFRLSTVGRSPQAALYGGISIKKMSTLSMVIAGAFSGLAGMIEVYGTYYRVLEGITVNFGFTAVMIAILAKNKPAGVIIGSLLISALTVGVNSMQIEANVPTCIVTVIQSVVVFSFLVMPAIRAKAAVSLSQASKG